MIDSQELIDKVCSICGDQIGMGFDHAECSKVKKEIYGDNHKSRAPKKLPKQSCDYLATLLRD